uniref:Uncharacterized protein n=1 Tax=Arundo donax TaxID=35708 RepID=A0A0A8ZHG7_ARUDO
MTSNGLPFNMAAVFSLSAKKVCNSSLTNIGYSSIASIILNNSSFGVRHVTQNISYFFNHTIIMLKLLPFFSLANSRTLARRISCSIALVFLFRKAV